MVVSTALLRAIQYLIGITECSSLSGSGVFRTDGGEIGGIHGCAQERIFSSNSNALLLPSFQMEGSQRLPDDTAQHMPITTLGLAWLLPGDGRDGRHLMPPSISL